MSGCLPKRQGAVIFQFAGAGVQAFTVPGSAHLKCRWGAVSGIFSLAGFLFAHHLSDFLALLYRYFVKGAISFPRGIALFRGELAPFHQAVVVALFLDGRQARVTFGGFEQAFSLNTRQCIPLLVQRGKRLPLVRAQGAPRQRCRQRGICAGNAQQQEHSDYWNSHLLTSISNQLTKTSIGMSSVKIAKSVSSICCSCK